MNMLVMEKRKPNLNPSCGEIERVLSYFEVLTVFRCCFSTSHDVRLVFGCATALLLCHQINVKRFANLLLLWHQRSSSFYRCWSPPHQELSGGLLKALTNSNNRTYTHIYPHIYQITPTTAKTYHTTRENWWTIINMATFFLVGFGTHREKDKTMNCGPTVVLVCRDNSRDRIATARATKKPDEFDSVRLTLIATLWWMWLLLVNMWIACHKHIRSRWTALHIPLNSTHTLHTCTLTSNWISCDHNTCVPSICVLCAKLTVFNGQIDWGKSGDRCRITHSFFFSYVKNLRIER